MRDELFHTLQSCERSIRALSLRAACHGDDGVLSEVWAAPVQGRVESGAVWSPEASGRCLSSVPVCWRDSRSEREDR